MHWIVAALPLVQAPAGARAGRDDRASRPARDTDRVCELTSPRDSHGFRPQAEGRRAGDEVIRAEVRRRCDC
jgi:hypothetical protein